MFKMFFVRYFLVAVISIVGFKAINQYPPISWFDSDRREISKLKSELELCKSVRDQALLDKFELEGSITVQNKAIENLSSTADEKQKEARLLDRKLRTEIDVLKRRLKTRQPEINSCQDAIDYLISENDE